MNTAYLDQSRQNYQERRIKHWDAFAKKKEHWHGWSNYYHRRLEEVYAFLIIWGQSP